MAMHAPSILLTLAITAAAQAQVPCSATNLGTNLLLVDESMSAGLALGFTFVYGGVAYSSIQVCDNGYITLGATGGLADFAPDPATLTGDPFPRICPLWTDLEPGVAGSGDVWFRAVPASGTTPAHAIVTWDRVFDYFGTTPHTFQLTLIDGGTIRIAFGQDLLLNEGLDGWLIGASPGNGAAQNAVSFATLPVVTSGNATLHEDQLLGGAVPYAGAFHEWVPDGAGGYVVTENTACASAVRYGRGCVGQFGSFYELFAGAPQFDLSGSSFSLLFSGFAYTVTNGISPFVPPSPGATNLNLIDDDEITVALSGTLSFPGGTTSSLAVGSNGYVASAATGAEFDFSPTSAEFLNWPTAAWAVWRDFVPTPSNNVRFEQVGTTVYVTWDAVVGYVGQTPGTTPSTFQIQFDLATGNVHFVFLSMDTTSVSGWPGGNPWVVGFTPAGASADSGSIDLTTAVPAAFSTFATELLPISLDAPSTPQVGTSITLDTSEIPTSAPFGAVLLGFTQFPSGLSLTGIGMPGCFRYTDGAASLLFLPLGSSSNALPFNVPNAPGVSVFAQSVVYAPATGLTPLGALASNGLTLRFGL